MGDIENPIPDAEEPELIQLPIDVINMISHYAGIIPSIIQSKKEMRAIGMVERSYIEAGRPVPYEMLDTRFMDSENTFTKLTELYTTLLRLRHRRR